ncbi:MAG: epoxyqueuosine reductase QueH [Candidatus Moraniibacteriota bacterium]
MPEKLLLHACCAPCGIVVMDELRRQFDLSILFFNPNIYPEAEYLKRKKEVVRLATEWHIPMLDHDFLPETWEHATKGFENEPEGGARCGICFRHRLFYTAEIAKKNNFDIFASTLTSGRNKVAERINAIGEAGAARFGVNFLAENWKKNGRQERSRAMITERGIYRQDYCGCKYSLQKKRA